MCARKGLHATFMCRPNLNGVVPSGWHMHQSVVDTKTGKNLMMPTSPDALSATAEGWIPGLLAHAGETCLLLDADRERLQALPALFARA